MKVAVDADALGQVLRALNGPGHLIRELQVLRSLPMAEAPNPIERLLDQYNAFVNSGPVDPYLSPQLSHALLAKHLPELDITPEKAHQIVTTLYGNLVELVSLMPLRASWKEVFELLLSRGLEPDIARASANALFPAVTLDQVQMLQRTLDGLEEVQQRAQAYLNATQHKEESPQPWQAVDFSPVQLEVVAAYAKVNDLNPVRVVQHVDQTSVHVRMATGRVFTVERDGTQLNTEKKE